MAYRNKSKLIKFSSEEWQTVCERAAALGKRTGTFIREISVQGVIKNYDMKQFNHLIMSFNRIGNELIEELQYRIENKNREISLSAVAKYQGVQREYAMCLRELQIMVYRKPDNLHNVTYGELRRNAELLTYLCDNNIHSEEDFQNVVNAAAEESDRLKKSRDKLLQGISERENILKDGARYIELNKIRMPTAVQLEELVKLNYLAKYKLHSEEDIESHRQELEKLKLELSETEESLETAEKEKSIAAGNYKTYLRQMQSDYDFVLKKMRREQEDIAQAERDLLHTQTNQRNNSYFER